MSAASAPAPAPKWNMPWACPSCRRTGHVQVVTVIGQRTSDAEVERMIHESHRRASDLCIRPADRILTGRLWRMKGGQFIWMLKAGETHYTLEPEAWPPWQRES